MTQKKTISEKTDVEPKSERSAWAEKRRETRQAKTWAQIVRLADEALAALDANKVPDVRRYLNAIRGVAGSADAEQL